MNELLRIIRERHSTRCAFDPERPVPRDVLNDVLEAARWSPTAHNMQNFQIVVVEDRDLLAKLGTIPAEPSETFIRENFQQLSFSEEELQRKRVGILASTFPPSWLTAEPDMTAIAHEPSGHRSLHDAIHDSPAVLVVVYDPRLRAPASDGDFLGAVSLGCVLENMWLMAGSHGLTLQVLSLFAGGRAEAQVCEVLAIPAPLRVAFALRLGYPRDARPTLRVRRELSDFVHYERFNQRRR